MSRRELVGKLADHGISLQQTSLRRIEEGQQAVKIEEAQAFAEIFQIDLTEFITKPVNPVEARLRTKIQHIEERADSLVSHAYSFFVARHSALDTLKEEDVPPAEQSSTVRELQELHSATYELARASVEVITAPSNHFSPVFSTLPEDSVEKLRDWLEEEAKDDGEG